MEDRDVPIQLCQVCGYDMTRRAHGETCPECGVALDTRPDDERYIQAGIMAKWLLITAIVFMVAVPPIGVILGICAAFQLVKRHDAKLYRLSYRARSDRKRANQLAYLWFGVFLVMVAISELAPNWLFWLN